MKCAIDAKLMTCGEISRIAPTIAKIPCNTSDMEQPDQSPKDKLSERKPSMGWARPLARPITVRGGPTLATLGEVRTFMFRRLQTHGQPPPAWQRVTALLLAAARSDEVDVADVTIALEMAASMDQARRPEPATTPSAPPAAPKPAPEPKAAPAKATPADTTPAEAAPAQAAPAQASAKPDARAESEAAVKPPAPGRPSFLSKVFR